MESQNIEFREVIKFLTKEGAKAKEIHRCMADMPCFSLREFDPH